MLNWKGQAFAPNASLDPSSPFAAVSWGLPTAVSVNLTKINNQTNKTRVDIRILDSTGDLPTLQNMAFPYRRICITAKANGSDPGNTNGNWNKNCYRVYVRLPPKLTNTCPNPWVAAAAAAAAGLPAPASPPPLLVPCPQRALQALSVVGAGQAVSGRIYYLTPMSDGTPQCTYCDRVQIAVLSDPGIPNGAAVGPLAGGPASEPAPPDYTNMVRLAAPGDPDPSNPPTAFLYSRSLAFTPSDSAAQLLTFELCVVATAAPAPAWAQVLALPPQPAPAPAPDCFRIQVAPPAPAVHAGRTDFGVGGAATVYVRCNYTFTIVTYETKEVGEGQGM